MFFFFVLTECVSPCSDENTTLEVPHVALVPIQTSSPERRITSQKEIIAGEERPKYLLIKQLQEAQGMCIFMCHDCFLQDYCNLIYSVFGILLIQMMC